MKTIADDVQLVAIVNKFLEEEGIGNRIKAIELGSPHLSVVLSKLNVSDVSANFTPGEINLTSVPTTAPTFSPTMVPTVVTCISSFGAEAKRSGQAQGRGRSTGVHSDAVSGCRLLTVWLLSIIYL